MNTQEIVKALLSAGMTQARIAKAIGCTQAAISYWLAGRCEANVKYYIKMNDILTGNASKELLNEKS